MTGLSKERVESFRALPQALRAELLTQITRDAAGISRSRLRRIVHIVDRHLFGGEPVRVSCENLKISRQQFYSDLREGVRLLTLLVDRKQTQSTKITIENPRQTIISQARAAHQAGMSQRAIDMLQRLHAAPLRPSEVAEITGLELGVREDLMMPFASLRGTVELVDAARVRVEDGDASEDDRTLLDGTYHWVRTYLRCYENDRKGFLREYEAMISLLRPRAFAGNRDAAIAFCDFMLTAPVMLDSFGSYLDEERAERALSDVDDLLRLRDDMPAAFLSVLHTRYATFFSGKAGQAHRFREEWMWAYKLGIERLSTPSIWFALGMEVPQSLALGETTHALACASSLYQSVSASESVEWKLLARMILARAYNAVGRFTEAQRLIPMSKAFPELYGPNVILPACETLLGLCRYRECFDLATRLADDIKGPHRAWALILRARAAYYSGNGKKAAADIRDAIMMFDSIRGHSFYTVCSAYRTAHLITREKRYLDMLRVVETILEDGAPAISLAGQERGLTARQRAIARLAVAGETNSGIARRLNISPRTVKNSLNAIYARLGIRARWQLPEAVERVTTRTSSATFV